MFSSQVCTALFVATNLAIGAVAKDTWGPAVSFGPSKSTIINTKTILLPGKAPVQPKNGFLTIWPGMSNGTGNLIQTTLESHEQGKPRCGERSGEWCVMASVFGRPWGQLDSKQQAVVRGDQKIMIEYKLSGRDWTQIVTDVASSKVISTLKTASEPYMRGYGTGTECQRDCHGTIEDHFYLDTEITFKDPEPGFKLGASQGATFTKPISEDGGRRWRIEKMTIPAMRKN